MNSESVFFKMHAECKLVKGYCRSAIYDLPRGSYRLIPNDLYDILTNKKLNTISKIKQYYDVSQHHIIDEYFKMLISNEFIFFCDEDELDLFPDIDMIWDYPGVISNAIIELPMNMDRLNTSIKSLEKLGCRFIQMRSFDVLDSEYIKDIVASIKYSDFDYLEIISKFKSTLVSEIKAIMINNQRLRNYYFHSANENKVYTFDRQKIVFIKEQKKSHSDFLVNNKFYFNVNILLFSESQKYNNYYNRKVCISKEGYIKNCLSLNFTYGKVTDEHSLPDIVNTENFQKLWLINKDKIEVCKDCEFRYMCVDNTPIIKENEKWVKVKECFYNPHSPI